MWITNLKGNLMEPLDPTDNEVHEFKLDLNSDFFKMLMEMYPVDSTEDFFIYNKDIPTIATYIDNVVDFKAEKSKRSHKSYLA